MSACAPALGTQSAGSGSSGGMVKSHRAKMGEQ
jgi:hypothetical protein